MNIPLISGILQPLYEYRFTVIVSNSALSEKDRTLELSAAAISIDSDFVNKTLTLEFRENVCSAVSDALNKFISGNNLIIEVHHSNSSNDESVMTHTYNTCTAIDHSLISSYLGNGPLCHKITFSYDKFKLNDPHFDIKNDISLIKKTIDYFGE